MFNPSSSSAPTYSDLSLHHAVSFSSALSTAPTEIPRGGGHLHDNGGLFSLPNVAATAPPPYSSLPSYYIHRSTNSHSFPLHLQLPEPVNSNGTFSCSPPSACQLPLPPVSCSPSSSSGDLLEFSSGTLRRVFSTGDLLGMNVPPSPPPLPPFSGDNCSQEVGGPLSQKVGRYTAEERKERIEKYRIKRHQRNFHKKITVSTPNTTGKRIPFSCQFMSTNASLAHHLCIFQYACRKTLADSRLRVQGRFVRNLETEADAVAGLEREASDNSYEYCPYNDLTTNSSNSYDSQSLCRETGNGATFDNGKWWWETPVAAGAANGQQQQQLGFDVDDEDKLWASLADMCSGT